MFKEYLKVNSNRNIPEKLFFPLAIALQALLYHCHLSTHLQLQQQPDWHWPLHELVPCPEFFFPPTQPLQLAPARNIFHIYIYSEAIPSKKKWSKKNGYINLLHFSLVITNSICSSPTSQNSLLKLTNSLSQLFDLCNLLPMHFIQYSIFLLKMSTACYFTPRHRVCSNIYYI